MILRIGWGNDCENLRPQVVHSSREFTNMLPFLKERFDSIFNQTFQDWELFVYDSHSDDGAWAFIQDLEKTCDRMRIAQGPREGPYPAWNECLRRTSGEYVYIATSDDSMAPDFL